MNDLQWFGDMVKKKKKTPAHSIKMLTLMHFVYLDVYCQFITTYISSNMDKINIIQSHD